jgi:iron complex transport system ATP-binding protein
MTSPDLLRVKGLRFAYNGEGRQALDGLDLALEAGQVAAVLGPNGAGKTTLLHILLGILKPQAGTITLEGRELSQYGRGELSRILGLVPQFEHVAFEYNVEEYVLLGRAPHLGLLQLPAEEDLREAEAAMETLGVLAFRKRSILELSGGERQMVVLARALAQQVRLLLMDEPLAHLDLNNKYRILSVIRQLAANGTAVLFTTHEPDLVPSVADQVVLMRLGRAVASGSIEAVMTSAALSEAYGVGVRVHSVDGAMAVRLEDLL